MLALAGLAGTAFKAPNGIRASAVGMRASRMQMSTYATFKTSKGDFKAELFMDTLPITSSNFADLSKTGFYDGLTFHRVINGALLQPLFDRETHSNVATILSLSSKRQHIFEHCCDTLLQPFAAALPVQASCASSAARTRRIRSLRALARAARRRARPSRRPMVRPLPGRAATFRTSKLCTAMRIGGRSERLNRKLADIHAQELTPHSRHPPLPTEHAQARGRVLQRARHAVDG